MVYEKGKGRAPSGNAEVGRDVFWDEKTDGWKTKKKGFHWYGPKLGGWKKEKPVPMTPQKRKRLEDQFAKKQREKNPPVPRGARPKGNDKAGLEVSYRFDLDCYATDKDCYWHGPKAGGWKRYAPGTKPPKGAEKEDPGELNPDFLKTTRAVPGGYRGKRPKPPRRGDPIRFNEKTKQFVSSSGFVWHGINGGGWMKDGKPLAEFPKPVAATGGKKRGRKPSVPPGGTTVEFHEDYRCWFCESLDLYWHGTDKDGSYVGWKTEPPKKADAAKA